jgi:ABC-type transport system substrate-binding protein
MFSDSKLDSLLEENRYTQDQQVIKDNLIKIQEILSEKKPAIFIANPYFLYAKDKNIKGDILNIINLPAEKFENIED